MNVMELIIEIERSILLLIACGGLATLVCLMVRFFVHMDDED